MNDKAPAKQEIKFDKYAEELLDKIKSENITIDPTVWQLLNHLLGNRIYSLELAVGDFSSTPKWQLKAASIVIAFLHKISGGSGRTTPIIHYLERIQANVDQLDRFMKRLRAVTDKKVGF